MWNRFLWRLAKGVEAKVRGIFCQFAPYLEKIGDEQAEIYRHCPECGFPIDRDGFLKRSGYSHNADYNCLNCGHNIISIRLTGIGGKG